MEAWREELYSNMSNSPDIYHHGILGQKWGVRRYQNLDGTLTDAGRKRLYKTFKQNTYANDYTKNKEYERRKDFLKNNEYVSNKIKDIRNTKTFDEMREANKQLTNELVGKYGDKKVYDNKIGYTETLNESVSSMIYDILRDYGHADNETNGVNKLNEKYKNIKLTPSDEKEVSNIAKKFKPANDGIFNNKIAEFKKNGIEATVYTKTGAERSAAIAANEFFKKFDSKKALKGITDFYFNIDDVKSKKDLSDNMVLRYVYLDPLTNSYSTAHENEKYYGDHWLDSDGDMDTLKIKQRSMNG